VKNQTNPTIKAYLLRSAVYVLLLLAVCVIPFALAQRGAPKRGVAVPNQPAVPKASGITLSQLLKLRAATSGAFPGQGVTQETMQLRRGPAFVEIGRVNTPQLPSPKAPAVVLYDQYDNNTGVAFESNFHADDPAFVDYMADDFVVPGGETWTITEVDAMGIQFGVGGATFNVAFYTNGAGNLPDTQVYSTNNGTYTTNGTDWVITIPPAILTPGTYWVLVQGNGSNIPFNSWFWTGRSVQSNDTAAWQQPGNAYGRNCLTWERKPICFSEVPNDPDQVFRLVGTTGGGTPSPTPTSTPTPTPGPCQFQVLIVYADTEGLPTQLQSQILAEPGVTTVDLFDANLGTPTLGQLQQYNIVVPFSNSPFFDADTLGNNLADYVDGGGIVVQYGFAHYGPGQPYGINGRWVTDGYNPYDYSANLEGSLFSLGAFNAGHPLMAGVATLNSNFANVVTPNAAATEVAQNSLGESLVAFRPVGTHTTVGVTAYVGAAATQSGDWGKVVVNAGNWLLNCQGSPTPTPTPTPSVTPSVTPTPSATPSVTPTPTPSVTPTVTPTPTPTPSGCVFSQGYWKNHPDAWPVTELQLGNVTYTQDQLLSILHEPVRGNGILILAHQEIAAKLNIANGADGSCIQQTLADADALIGDLVVPPVGDGYLHPQEVSGLADTLDDYNEGRLCAPSCDNEGSPTPAPSPRHPPVLPRHQRPPR
jgi:hypothetical protein